MKAFQNFALFLILIVSNFSFAQKTGYTMLDGYPIYASRTLTQNIATTKNFKTFSMLLKASEMESYTNGAENFTFFIPSETAFEQMPSQVISDLMKLENLDKLQKFVGGFIIKGKLTSKTLLGAVKTGNGKATFKTISGSNLTLTSKLGYLVATDQNGINATCIQSDIAQSNGILFVVDTVLMPKKGVEISKENKITYSLN